MKSGSLALLGPSGLLGTVESGETQFVLGMEEAADVLGRGRHRVETRLGVSFS